MKIKWVKECDVNQETATESLLSSCDIDKNTGSARTRIDAECECTEAACRKWVACGIAVPADTEADALCASRGITDDVMQKAQHAQDLMRAACLDPEHRKLFEAGYISRVADDGSLIPGPNWAKYQAELAAEKKAEDEAL